VIVGWIAEDGFQILHSYRLYLVIPSPEVEKLEAKKDKGFFTLSDSRRKQRDSNRRPVMQDYGFMKRVAEIFENKEHAGTGDTIKYQPCVLSNFEGCDSCDRPIKSLISRDILFYIPFLRFLP